MLKYPILVKVSQVHASNQYFVWLRRPLLTIHSDTIKIAFIFVLFEKSTFIVKNTVKAVKHVSAHTNLAKSNKSSDFIIVHVWHHIVPSVV